MLRCKPGALHHFCDRKQNHCVISLPLLAFKTAGFRESAAALLRAFTGHHCQKILGLRGAQVTGTLVGVQQSFQPNPMESETAPSR